MPIMYAILFSVSAISFVGVSIKNNSNRSVYNTNIASEYYTKSIGLSMAILTFSLLCFFVVVRSFYGDTSMYMVEYDKYTPVEF